MVLLTTGYECVKHGAPKTDRPVTIKPKTQVELAKPRKLDNRIRTRPTRRLPNSPDGRPRHMVTAEHPVAARSKFTDAKAQEVLAREKRGESVRSIANSMYEELGYKSMYSCVGAIYRILNTVRRLSK